MKDKKYKDYLLDEVKKGRMTLDEVKEILYWFNMRKHSAIPNGFIPNGIINYYDKYQDRESDNY